MAIEVVDGTLEPALPRSTKRGYSRFDVLRIQTADGTWREFPKVSTGPGIADHLRAGGPGRFYFIKVDGPLGLFGVRRPDGAAHYAHYTNSETIVLVVAVLGTLCAIARFGFGVQAPWLAAVIGPFLLAGWFYLNSRKQAAKRTFDADNG